MNNDSSIYERQNDRKILLLLKAQRAIYTKAKWVLYSSLFLGIMGTAFFAYLTTKNENQLWSTLSSFFALLVFAVNTILATKSSDFVSIAARIQQTIDIMLFRIEKDCNILTDSEINNISAPYLSSDLSKYNNWYDDYSSLPYPKQVFFAQKENVRWDDKLRYEYSCLMIFFAITIPIGIFTYSILINANMSHFFGIIAWIFPLEQFFVSQCVGLKQNIKTLSLVQERQKHLETHIDNDSDDSIYCGLCNVQMCIYENRKQSILVPDWFYSLRRKAMQSHEKSVAELSRK